MASKSIAVKGTVQTEPSSAILGGLTIALFDQHQRVTKPIASVKTNEKGAFKFKLNSLKLDRLFGGSKPQIYLTVSVDDRLLYTTIDEFAFTPDKDIKDLKINLPEKSAASLIPVSIELPALNVKSLLKISGVSGRAISKVEEKLKQEGLSKSEDLLSKPSRLTSKRTGLEEENLIKFRAAAHFAAISGSEKMSEKLIEEGFRSLSEVGALSYTALNNKVGKLNVQEKKQLNLLYQRASSFRNEVLNEVAFTSRLDSRDGQWQLSPAQQISPQTASNNESCQCSDCDNVFSPYAFLICLLDMIHDHWQMSVASLEKVLLQNINDLDCDTAYECYLQIELAIEVLEKGDRLTLPLSDDQLKTDAEKIWINLLFGIKENDRSYNTYRDLLKALAKNGSNRVRSTLRLLADPGLGLESIRKGIEELKKEPKIQDLKERSPRYAEGGEGFDSGLDEAYRQVLLLYRDSIIRNANTSIEKLQSEYFIDLKAGTCQKTNRLTFLILSIQSFVLAARTGQLSNFSRSDLNTNFVRNTIQKLDALPIEEASWKWLKDYPSWASAMYVFLYPENIVIPFMGSNFAYAFREQRDALLNTLQANQAVLKEAYLRMLGKIIGGDLVQLSNHPEGLPFYHPEAGMLVDTVFFPTDLIYEENISNANSFIAALNGDPSLQEWLDGIDTYIEYLCFSDCINERIDIEKNLYFPLLAAWLLNRSENYAAAHDWLRRLYDPTKSGIHRLVFDFDAYFSLNITFGEDWENGILEPEEIARRRQGVMLRHVILTMVKNLLDWADHEFAMGTTSGLDRARRLYELAKHVLDSPDLSDHCGQSVRQLIIEIVESYSLNPALVTGTLIGTIENLNQIDDPQIIEQAINEIRGILPVGGNIDPPREEKVRKIVDKTIEQYKSNNVTIKLEEKLERRKIEITKHEDSVLENSVTNSSYSGISPYFINFSAYNSTNLVSRYFESDYRVNLNPITFCVPPNPVLRALYNYIHLSLLKFQLCLDISGEPLPAVAIDDESVAEFFDTIDAEVERQPFLDTPANWFNEPPRYRYTYLVEKARQYTDAASRIGSTLLSAYEKLDNEKLSILRARHGIELASSTVDLRNLGLKDARTGLELADLQVERSNAQLDFWQQRIDEGMLSDKEQLGVDLMFWSGHLSVAAGVVQGLGAIVAFVAGGAGGAAGGGMAGTVVPGAGNAAGAVGGGAAGFSVGAALAAAIPGTAGALSAFSGALGAYASANLTYASFERRSEDWNLQRDLSDFDSRIAEIQKRSATNRIDIADQELSISQLQHTQSREILTFLENKFSNDHLYVWMVHVLSQNYRSLMQVSSNVARIAQRALEFERQEKVNIIIGDYWSINNSIGYSGNLSNEQKESGLLGAERLLTDLSRLDAYKLGTETRRLQISKTISMAQIVPGELVQLKQSGKVTFNTLMNWFDRDYPGHYLRLIKSVKLSILALTPPTDGIHAMLSNNGESTVVIRDGIDFVSRRTFRDFGEKIALDSPFNETGLFVFDYNDPMFLPFEGLGVETQWTLELPKSSNRFNFDTLIDVMLTMEYTALHSDEYAINVREALGKKESNEIPNNFRIQYPDEWYHYKNDPLAADGTRNLKFELLSQQLPTQYDGSQPISTLHVTVILVGEFDGLNQSQRNKLLESVVLEHEYDDGSSQLLKLASSPVSGSQQFKSKKYNPENHTALFSTRDNNDLGYAINSGIDPTGDWRLFLNDNLGGNLSLGELVSDVLIIITTQGHVDWSA